MITGKIVDQSMRWFPVEPFFGSTYIQRIMIVRHVDHERFDKCFAARTNVCNLRPDFGE